DRRSRVLAGVDARVAVWPAGVHGALGDPGSARDRSGVRYPVSHEPRTRSTNPEGDIAFVAWLARWAFLTALLIILFDLAVFRNYPFPDALDRFRAAFYTLYGGVVLLASIVFAFLGYRVVTTGYQV